MCFFGGFTPRRRRSSESYRYIHHHEVNKKFEMNLCVSFKLLQKERYFCSASNYVMSNAKIFYYHPTRRTMIRRRGEREKWEHVKNITFICPDR